MKGVSLREGMGRSSMSYCGLKENVVVGRKEEEEIEVKRGAWTREEDEKLISFIQRNHGHHGTWKTLPKLAGMSTPPTSLIAT